MHNHWYCIMVTLNVVMVASPHCHCLTQSWSQSHLTALLQQGRTVWGVCLLMWPMTKHPVGTKIVSEHVWMYVRWEGRRGKILFCFLHRQEYDTF